nr:DUF5320 domain-containing protein [candidate division Zixibacteria bacterium]
MPGGDRTGPMGQGPMTGRGAGFCAGYGRPGYMNRFLGGGFGSGRGMGRGGGRGFGGGGRGWRNMYYATGLPGWNRPYYPAGYAATGYAPAATGQDELAELKDQAGYLKSTLEDINRRIEQLEKSRKES